MGVERSDSHVQMSSHLDQSFLATAKKATRSPLKNKIKLKRSEFSVLVNN